jgi:hypothetical protein
MFIARTADLIADENIRCRGIEAIDPAGQGWVLVDLDASDFLSDAGWRVIGGYASEAEAIAAAPRGERVARFPALAVG